MLRLVPDDTMSVSHIIADDTNSGVCTFTVVDGSVAVLNNPTDSQIRTSQRPFEKGRALLLLTACFRALMEPGTTAQR